MLTEHEMYFDFGMLHPIFIIEEKCSIGVPENFSRYVTTSDIKQKEPGERRSRFNY